MNHTLQLVRSSLGRATATIPRPESSRPPAVPPPLRAIRGPLSDEELRPASCHPHATPARERHAGGKPGPVFGAAALRASSRAESPAGRPPSPSSGPRRPPSGEELRPAGCLHLTAPAKGPRGGGRPTSIRSDADPRTSSRVESPASRPSSPSGDPRITVGRGASTRGLRPSSHPRGRPSGCGPASSLRDADTAYIVSMSDHLRTGSLRRPKARRPAFGKRGIDPRAAAVEPPVRGTVGLRTRLEPQYAANRSESSLLAKRPPPTLPSATTARSTRIRRDRSTPPGLEIAVKDLVARGPESRRPSPRQVVSFRRTVLRVLPATKAP